MVCWGWRLPFHTHTPASGEFVMSTMGIYYLHSHTGKWRICNVNHLLCQPDFKGRAIQQANHWHHVVLYSSSPADITTFKTQLNEYNQGGIYSKIASLAYSQCTHSCFDYFQFTFMVCWGWRLYHYTHTHTHTHTHIHTHTHTHTHRHVVNL